MTEPEPETAQPNVLDLSLKTLCRRVPGALLRLAGVDPGACDLRFEDVSVILPEFRADQVLKVARPGQPARWAVHFEYQAQPRRSVLVDWWVKNAALNAQLEIPVFLVALYLEKGDRATFPAEYIQQEGPLVTGFRFNAIRLWEHADRIRTGELPELAPLLLLCETRPDEETLRFELELIRTAAVPETVRTDLLAVAYMLGTRYFLRAILDVLFKEDLPMLKDCGIISDWMEEANAHGRTQEARSLTLSILTRRFGPLPLALQNRIAQADREWCEALLDRVLGGATLDELLGE